MPRPTASQKAVPTKRAPPLKADPERYPNLAQHPDLERALRIRQALAAGTPRDEAVRIADATLGPRPVSPRPKRKASTRAARRPA